MSATALQLLLTAERLFAEHGVTGVSLRQIAAEAGSANNSAVHYHFGSREGLVGAILSYRLPALQVRRRLLLERLPVDDLRARLEAHFVPLFELAEAGEGAYLSFVEQLQRSRTAAEVFGEQDQEHRRLQEAFVRDVLALLPHVDEPVAVLRIVDIQSSILHAAAERERAAAAGTPRPAFGLFVSSVLDGVAGYLQAPVSEETRRFLEREGTQSVLSVRLL